MDLGIQGKWALVCAASKGLGKGCGKREHAHGLCCRAGATKPAGCRQAGFITGQNLLIEGGAYPGTF